MRTRRRPSLQRTRRRAALAACACACACACALAAPGAALAQRRRAAAPPAPDASASRARAEFEQGVRYLEDGRYADAAAAFERSLALRESPTARLNVALAYRGMGAHRRAIAALERFVATPGTAARALLESARDTLAELRATLPRLAIRVTGSPSQVLLDGQPVAAGDGLYQVDVDPGAHVVEGQRAGYRPARQSVQVASAQRAEVALNASREPLPGTLVVETQNPRAQIRIDGRAVGAGEVTAAVPMGTHQIAVYAPGAAPQRRTIHVGPGARVVVSVSARSPTLTDQWWFWTGVGVVAAGAGVLVGVAAFSRTDSPIEGTLGVGQTITLGR